MDFRLFGAPEETLSNTDVPVGVRQISVDRKRPLVVRQFPARPDWCKSGRSPDTGPRRLFRRDRQRLDRRGPPPPPSELPGRRSMCDQATRFPCERRRQSHRHCLDRGQGRARTACAPPRERSGVNPLLYALIALKIEVHRIRVDACSARRASAMMSWALRAFARRATISSCMSNRSATVLSNRSAQR